VRTRQSSRDEDQGENPAVLLTETNKDGGPRRRCAQAVIGIFERDLPPVTGAPASQTLSMFGRARQVVEK